MQSVLQNSSLYISVCLITYNQEGYISQAIESIVNQKTSFSFELIIGEDCSKDNTRQVCEAYQQRYPGLIRLLPSSKNYGMMGNFIRTLNSANGKYIAFCEGDDYWSDENKLQKQVEFLESNTDYTLVGHNYERLYKNNTKGKVDRRPEAKNSFVIDDYIKSHFIHINTLLYKKVATVPDWFSSLSVGDQPLIIYMAQYGKIGYMNDFMSVYRINDESFMSTNKVSQVIKNFIKDLMVINEKTYHQYEKSFAVRIRIEQLMYSFCTLKYFSKQLVIIKNAAFIIKYRKFIFKDDFSFYKLLIPNSIKSLLKSVFKA